MQELYGILAVVLTLREMCSGVVGVWSSVGVSQLFIRGSIIWCNKNYCSNLQILYFFPQNVKLSCLGKERVLGGFSFQYSAMQSSVICPKAI